MIAAASSGSVVDARLGEPERHRERDEALLRAVVEVALEHATRLVGRLDDARARGPDLLVLAPALGHVDAGEEHERRLAPASRRRSASPSTRSRCARRSPCASASRARRSGRRSPPMRSPSARSSRRRDRSGRARSCRTISLSGQPSASRNASLTPARVASTPPSTMFASRSTTTTMLGIACISVLVMSRSRCSWISRCLRSVTSRPLTRSSRRSSTAGRRMHDHSTDSRRPLFVTHVWSWSPTVSPAATRRRVSRTVAASSGAT